MDTTKIDKARRPLPTVTGSRLFTRRRVRRCMDLDLNSHSHRRVTFVAFHALLISLSSRLQWPVRVVTLHANCTLRHAPRRRGRLSHGRRRAHFCPEAITEPPPARRRSLSDGRGVRTSRYRPTRPTLPGRRVVRPWPAVRSVRTARLVSGTSGTLVGDGLLAAPGPGGPAAGGEVMSFKAPSRRAADWIRPDSGPGRAGGGAQGGVSRLTGAPQRATVAAGA